MTGGEWSGLGFNPAPGAPHVVENLVESLTKLSKHLNETYEVMDKIRSGRDNTWTGEAADAFKEHVGKLPKYLRDAADGATRARRALNGWAQVLHENQPKARHLEEQAKQAKARLDAAHSEHAKAKSNPDLGLAGKEFSGEQLDRAKQRYKAASDQLDAAVSKLNTAQDQLDTLIKRAERLEDDHESVAHAKERAIREAADGTAGDWNDFSDWWSEHGGDVLGVVGGVLGVAAFFCPLLAPVAVLCSLAAMGQHAYQYAKAGELWPPQKHIGNYLTLGGDMLGALPGVGLAGKGLSAGADAAGGLRGAVMGAEGMSRGANLAQGVRTGASAFNRELRAMATDAPQASPMVRDLVESSAHHMRPGQEFSSQAIDAIARKAAIGVDSATTGAQTPALFTDSDTASYANSVGGGAGNILSGMKDGPTGTVIGIASTIGLGPVVGGAE
ncbi:putative T7SS-secreted protein [Streptomyces marispadix]|uniref:Putative T7SS secretion signal domain-containing protein n=1 Tax=Streptomyces marispadix TaxID=2922868 RepID=A0ABS9T4P9_9ACTN|nr:hypothetical protein [Streptomyces marispadix]MCH6163504.1 hypothetical protein [Streptomyces marispadix]